MEAGSTGGKRPDFEKQQDHPPPAVVFSGLR